MLVSAFRVCSLLGGDRLDTMLWLLETTSEPVPEYFFYCVSFEIVVLVFECAYIMLE